MYEILFRDYRIQEKAIYSSCSPIIAGIVFEFILHINFFDFSKSRSFTIRCQEKMWLQGYDLDMIWWAFRNALCNIYKNLQTNSTLLTNG